MTLAPVFMGIDPAEVPDGDLAGLRAMADETDLALDLVRSLDEAQADQAVLRDVDPEDLAVAIGGEADFPAPAGIPASDLDAAQRAALLALIGAWVEDQHEGWAAPRMAEIEADLNGVHFAWMGDTDPDGRFYYRIHGPTLYVEYDHVGGPDHVHAMYRDPLDDYGADLLAQHRARFDH